MTGRGDRLEVARFSMLREAELAASLLRSKGIDADVPDRQTLTMDGLLTSALGGVRVTVPDSQAAEARLLIAEARDGAFVDDADDGWMEDHTPGRVGDLNDDEIHGALSSSRMRTAGKVIIVLMLMLPVLSVASCVIGGVLDAAF